MDAIERLRSLVRTAVRQVAKGLHTASRGAVGPNMVTIAGLILHGFIVWLIVSELFMLAGVSLIVFGLFDTLDGELARLQHKSSAFGMVLDATSDRIKEGMILGAIAFHFADNERLSLLVLTLAVLVLAFAISYVKAKAETAIAAHSDSVSQANRRYQNGLARFEVRMTLIVFGLIFSQLVAILWLLLVLNLWTVIDRTIQIKSDLADA